MIIDVPLELVGPIAGALATGFAYNLFLWLTGRKITKREQLVIDEMFKTMKLALTNHMKDDPIERKKYLSEIESIVEEPFKKPVKSDRL